MLKSSPRPERTTGAPKAARPGRAASEVTVTTPAEGITVPPVHPTHDALLEAAEELFAQHGYAAVGIREIAERAKANIAAIKYHFGSKSGLYLATVRRAMSRGEAAAAWDALRGIEPEARPAPDPSAAAIALVRFVRLLLDRMINETPGNEPRCCALMLREAAEPSEAIDAVVRDFIQPSQGLLMNVLRCIAGGDAVPEAQLAASATSVMSQILHYRIFRPFLDRMPQTAPHAHDLNYLAAHIARFSLRGMGVADHAIGKAIDSAMPANNAD
jgi:AcrR family transcriptional regulator